MTLGTHIDHLVPMLVQGIKAKRGVPDRRMWQQTYHLSDDATTDLFERAIAIVDAEKAEIEALKRLPEEAA